jgi:ubiquinone/menaquinone biosynthesis C-methylase UbiE
MNIIEKTVRILTNNPLVYDLAQIVLEGDYHSAITDTVDAESHESVLEIGCGTGHFARFFDTYTGIDIEPKYIEAAQRRYAGSSKAFRVGDATALTFPDKSFDKVIIINVIHHLSDDEVRAVLKEAKRLAKKKFYVFDMTTDRDSFITPLLLYLDNGKFVRPLAAQVALIKESFTVDTSFTFKAPRKLLRHSAIVCSV